MGGGFNVDIRISEVTINDIDNWELIDAIDVTKFQLSNVETTNQSARGNFINLENVSAFDIANIQAKSLDIQPADLLSDFLISIKCQTCTGTATNVAVTNSHCGVMNVNTLRTEGANSKSTITNLSAQNV